MLLQTRIEESGDPFIDKPFPNCKSHLTFDSEYRSENIVCRNNNANSSNGLHSDAQFTYLLQFKVNKCYENVGKRIISNCIHSIPWLHTYQLHCRIEQFYNIARNVDHFDDDYICSRGFKGSDFTQGGRKSYFKIWEFSKRQKIPKNILSSRNRNSSERSE